MFKKLLLPLGILIVTGSSGAGIYYGLSGFNRTELKSEVKAEVKSEAKDSGKGKLKEVVDCDSQTYLNSHSEKNNEPIVVSTNSKLFWN